jgi:predicted NBD/HSP70 family sugar kinase
VSHLHLSGPLTRAELTARMGLNRSTIGVLVSELVSLGAVREERPAGIQAAAGRPSLVVRPADELQVLAADIGVDRVILALLGLGGRVVARRQQAVRSEQLSPSAAVELLSRLSRDLLADSAAGSRLVGMGVSVPGVVRNSDGLVRFAPNLGWVDEPFGSMLAARAAGRLSVRVGNDADLGALAEHRRGAAVGYDDVVFVAGEVGVGGGLIVGGQPVQGAGGYAGELGHMPVRPGGLPCRCGARGCWETEIGAGAICDALGLVEATTEDLVLAIHRAATEGTTALDDVGTALGLGLATIVNVLNPQLVILGGLLREVFPAVEDGVRRTLERAALAAAVQQVELAVPSLGGDAVLVGAAEVAWHDLLSDPAEVLGSAGGVSPARPQSLLGVGS